MSKVLLLLFYWHLFAADAWSIFMGVGRGGQGCQGSAWILKLIAKKGCFFNFEG